jgi:hypothetical protein
MGIALENQRRQESQVRAVVERALKEDPELAAERQRLSQTSGLPLSVVERNLDEIRRKEAARTLDIQRMMRDSPILARQLLDPSFTTIAQDDIGVLGEIERSAKDLGITALKGAVGLPQAFVGLGDIITLGRVGKALESIGYRPSETQKILSGLYSEATQRQLGEVGSADGFWNTLDAIARNPRALVATVVESLPQMLGGAAVARGIGALAPRLSPVFTAAAGEGTVAAGASAAQIRDLTANRELTPVQAAAAVGSGVGTAVFGAAGGRLAQRMGLGDIDTALAAGTLTGAPKAGFAKQVLGQGISEGLFEELPQSAQEQMWQNFALDRPLLEGVGNAAAMGFAAGLATGGTFGATSAGLARMYGRAIQDAESADRALLSGQALQRAFELAGQSALRQRSPEQFRTLMGQMSGDAKVYVDGEVLNQLPPEALAALPTSVRDRIATAAATGDTVEINVADALTVAPGTPLAEALTQHARTSPDAPSAFEAQTAGEQAQVFLQQEAERVIAQAQDQVAARASQEAVKAEVKRQLQATGRFRDAVNEGYATWASAFYTAYGSRLGMTAEQFFQRYPLRVLGAAPGQQTGVLNAPRLGRLDGIEGFHFSKADRPTIITSAFGTGLEGSAREQYLNAADRRLRQRSYFYVDKGTGINPEAGVGGRAQRVNLDNVYDADADPLRLKTGRDQLGFESAVLDAGFAGYLTRMEGTQSGQVIMLGDQTFQAEVLGPMGRTQGRVVPPPAQRPAAGRDVTADALRARRDLPGGELTRQRWGEILQRLAPAEYEALAAAGVFEGEGRLYKDGLIRDFESRTQAPVYNQSFDAQAAQLAADITATGNTVQDVMQVDQLIASNDVRTITLQDLVGLSIFPTIADRTAAAALYTGIDSSRLDVAVPLLGGPFFPLRESNVQAGVAWANRGKGVVAQKAAKLKQGANYMMVLMGDANMHQSNSTVAAAFMGTLEAWARDGRISPENVQKLGDLVRGAPSPDAKVKGYLEGFPGFADSARMHAYVDGISFDARKRILQIMASKEALALGAPPMQKILDATREPSLAGHRWGDGVLLIEVDQTNPQVELGAEGTGTMQHPDYPLGVRGRVVGKLNAPINWELLWQDWLRENADKDGPRRAFELAKPIVTVTQELVDRIGPIEQPNIDGARQARLAADFAAGNWRTSDNAVNKGGVSPQAFIDALMMSDAKDTLTQYTLADIKAGIKAGTKKIYQLGDGQIFFLLETREDGTKYLASVVNNERGARGIGAPAVVLKALEEGATDLDCFAVKNAKYPDGFLPALYGAFGFEVSQRYTFNPQYFQEQLPENERRLALADAVEYWKTSTPGFDPKAGMPDAVTMVWKGTDNDRREITQRYLRSGIEGLLSGRVDADVGEFSAEFGPPAEGQTDAAAPADGGRAAGDQGARAGASVASRARGTVQAVAELSDNELANLSLTADDRAAVRRALGLPDYELTQPAQGGLLEQADRRTASDILADFENARLIPDSAVLATLGEFPQYLQAVADFMVEQRQKLVDGRMTVRDIAKAYFITIASMGSDAIGVQTLQNKTGLQIDPMFINDGKVRPEEAAAAWLLSPDGKAALDALEAGRFDAELWDRGAGIRRAYGDDRFATFRAFDSSAKGYNFLRLQELTDKVNALAKAGDFKGVGEEVNKLNGIGQGKIGFIKHMLGMGDAPTIDAVEINFWLTGQGEIGQLKTEKAALAREIKAVSSDKRVSKALFDRISNRFNGLHDQVAGGSISRDVFQHIMHHWLWDRAKGIETTHEGMYDALRYAQGPRGTFNPQTLELVLNPNADLSTWFHETGHFFLEVMADVASQPGAPAQITEDMDAFLKWAGIPDLATWNSYSLDQKRPYHERWAESIEQYVMEGKAPSVELAPVMRRFRAWLVSVYQSIKQFVAGRPGAEQQPLNDDIRRVMDRMLATDEQIQQANEVAGLVPDEQADGEAAERLQKRSIADLKWAVKARDKVIAKLKREAKTIEKQVRAEVTAEIDQRPEVLAKAAIEKAEKEFEADPVSADMNIAAIADSFGYPSVEAMYRAIDLFGDKQAAIDGLAERRMLEEHGDLIDERAITEAANEAVHNEARARSLATELRTQQEMLGGRADTGQVNARGARMTVNVLVEAAKQFGANVIARTPLKDLRATAWKHTAAERRAGKRWQEATMVADTQAAVQAKQDQMLNNAAAKAALDAAAEAKKILEFFRRVTKGNDEKVVEKGRDPDIVNAARAVLAAYGVETPASKGAAAYLEVLQRNDPDTYNAIAPMMAAATQNAQPLEALTFEELQGLNEAVRAMWFLAKRSRQMEVDGNLLDIEDVAQELFARMEEIGIPDRVPGEGMAVTKEEERGLFLKQGIAFLRRVEQWAEGMDGKYGGPFLKFVFQPIKDAADRYRKDRLEYRKKFQALVDNLAPIIGDSVIEAPELGYVFGAPGSTAGTAMNEILHAIAHTGNDSNKRKLLLGRGWATELPDGTLDTTQWDAFINRLVAEGKLVQGHYDFVQGVWDLLEETKPLAQKAHRDAFGRYFSEVTANEFIDPFGVMRRGGYVPAQVDSRLVKDNALRKLAEEENNSMAFAFPQPTKGFTMSRVDDYSRELMLDLRSLSQHIDKVLLFSHMTNPARDVRKLLTRKEVSQPLDRIQPAALESMLQPWLQRSAQQIVETPIVGSGKWARIPGMVRARAGMALMFANVSNAVQQITGLSTAAVRVGPTFLMRSLAQYVANPRQFSREVWAASPYMDDRAKNEVAVLNEQMQAILLKPSTFERVQDWSYRHAYFLQTALDNVLSPIVWNGAFNQALAQGMSDKDAVRFADSTVRQTQGSTLPEDVSRFETGPAYARAFTQFIGYFNMIANTNGTALKQIAGEVGLRKGAGRALYVVMMGLMVPIWAAEAIALALRGGPEDEDDDGYLDDWLAEVFGFGTAKGLLAMIPIGGQAVNSAVTRLDNNPLNDRISLSPGLSLLESALGGNVQTVYELLNEDKDVNARRAIRDAATLVSVLTGVPLYAAARPIGYAAGVAEGKIEPEGPVDLARGLITGTASPESKQR